MWSSHATHRKVPYTGLHARKPRRAVILHTNGGGSDHGSLFGWWSGNAAGHNGADNRHVGAHFQVMTDGRAEEYVDTAQVVYHAYSASEFAVGIETQDDGHPERPWTPAQCDTIIAICRELKVPRRLLLDGPSDGVGWHEQYRNWNQSGHSCPGKVREQQIHDVILPALRAPTPAPKPKPAGAPPWYHRVLRVQSPYLHGPDVAAVQRKVRAAADGIYGPHTASKVATFQRVHHLTADGEVGPLTARAMGA